MQKKVDNEMPFVPFFIKLARAHTSSKQEIAPECKDLLNEMAHQIQTGLREWKKILSVRGIQTLYP